MSNERRRAAEPVPGSVLDPLRSRQSNLFPALPGGRGRGGSVVTVGAFDGVHRGHRDILGALRDRAIATGLPGVVVTFQPHPLAVVNPAAAPRLLTPGIERIEALAELPTPDYVVVLPFTHELASYTARRFVRELLVDRYLMRELVVGYDHGLGRGREGDVAALRGFGAELGFPVVVVPPTTSSNGAPISSSAIRRAVAYGQLVEAMEGLGRPYSFRGVVVAGSQRGRELGFPTVNLSIAGAEKLLPPEGVYAVRVWSRLGRFGGMLNLGGRPTFGDSALSPEVHLFDAEGDWYGSSLRVEFVARLRDTVRFDSQRALAEQLNRDALDARRALTQA